MFNPLKSLPRMLRDGLLSRYALTALTTLLLTLAYAAILRAGLLG